MFMNQIMQMNFVDYSFYANEQNRKNANIAGLFKFHNPQNISFKEKIIENLNKRIDQFPIMKSIVQESKIKNDFPYYVVDKNFNINNHIFNYNVFSDEEYNVLINEILVKEINFEKPLWEFHIINYKDYTYVIRRCHHAMGDGTQLSYATSYSDNIILTKKIHIQNKIGKIRSYINRFYKMFKTYYLFAYGFMSRSNKQIDGQVFKRENIYKGEWRPKRQYSLDFDFIKFDLTKIKKQLKNKKTSTLEFCFLLETLCYQSLLQEKVINKKDLISVLPRNYSQIKHYGNDLIVHAVDIPTSEPSISKIMERINLSLKIEQNITNTSPHVLYAAAFRSSPKISITEKAFKFANTSDWNNRRKIPKIKKDFCPIATSTTYYNSEAVSTLQVSGQKIEESYGISMPINVPGSIGVSLCFRKEGDNLYISISSFKEIFEAKVVKDNMLEAIKKAEAFYVSD